MQQIKTVAVDLEFAKSKSSLELLSGSGQRNSSENGGVAFTQY